MKIRINYVSNSSSTSFCILGIIKPNSFSIDDLYKLPRYSFLTYSRGISDYSDEEFIIGAEPSQMKNEETLFQFKERICSEFKEYNLDVKPEELKWFIDGGYDG